ncbi:unnamed protein product [Vitrella brassicaformis CCMP3155]|uniref:C3H1-type domain-containing protein n=1 Tax=Vitrella brassicaformis (strain CCMP3155) TaxID=1169540 RepID=A0A0G4ECL2_VITBC|nr:unnamed protein product [Vitrella brassicaformis CCMP3155]|eukprot:CEL93282.1 unnamed protein product [Vitrella brassicaformis CCMP3155]
MPLPDVYLRDPAQARRLPDEGPTEKGKMRVKNFCRRGRMCMYSHSKEEQMFHPLTYKTKLCRDFMSSGACPRYFCPFAHGDQELRVNVDFKVLQGPEVLDLPPMEVQNTADSSNMASRGIPQTASPFHRSQSLNTISACDGAATRPRARAASDCKCDYSAPAMQNLSAQSAPLSVGFPPSLGFGWGVGAGWSPVVKPLPQPKERRDIQVDNTDPGRSPRSSSPSSPYPATQLGSDLDRGERHGSDSSTVFSDWKPPGWAPGAQDVKVSHRKKLYERAIRDDGGMRMLLTKQPEPNHLKTSSSLPSLAARELLDASEGDKGEAISHRSIPLFFTPFDRES